MKKLSSAEKRTIANMLQITEAIGPTARRDAMSPHDLRKLLPFAWSVKSASVWRADNPAYGQCSVTALLVLHLFDGDLLKTLIGEKHHFYNRLNGERVDLTNSQFPWPPEYQDLEATFEEVLADTSTEQVNALLSAVLSVDRRHFDQEVGHAAIEPVFPRR